ncbi:unnamed protein product [Phyllotreta striolata]|uniref:Uncharacterized protein n=1 Tax=Phyllotreta striolata TaxID=444603 RepID=A0A9N9TP92_PHYSR|nr:unnamed protein product [Phyllotreta striolata]
MLTVIYLLTVLVLADANRDPLDFTPDTCVKVFYTGDEVYSIYCLSPLDDAEDSLGFVTDRNHKLIFKKHLDAEDEGKTCVNVISDDSNAVEKLCFVTIRHNCVAKEEGVRKEEMRNGFGLNRPAMKVPCTKWDWEDYQLDCFGVKHLRFNLISYCVPPVLPSRRTVINIPSNSKPPRE